MIPELYKDNLVELGNQAVKKNKAADDVAVTAVADSINFLGKNVKNIVILVQYAEQAHLPDEQLDFLSKILLACKLDLGDVAIVNTYRTQVNKLNINILNPKLLLIFGDCASNIVDRNSIDFFTPLNNGDFAVMTAPALEELSMSNDVSKQLKSKLWVSLKHFFKL